MTNTDEICRLFFESEFIPLFLYRNGVLSAQFPETALPVEPPRALRERLLLRQTDVSMLYSDASCLYFMVRADEDTVVFGGPVPIIWVNAETLVQLRRDYLIKPDEEAAFAEYMAKIPPYNNVVLGKKLNLLLFLFTGVLRHEVPAELFLSETDPSRFEANKETTNLLFSSHNRETYNNSYEIESMLVKFVMEGDLDGYEAFVKNVPPMSIGEVAPTGLRSIKNNLIISATLACRAAIRAGLPQESAYALSDAYIQEAEHINRADELLTLNASMLRDYIARVRAQKESSVPVDTVHNRLMHRCVNYIHRNLNHRITVEDLAAYVKLSRSYLSTTFRQCMGVPLNRYILDAKLEEAASLLRYTDRPVSDIAEYLCFSSQSHFQQAFKEKYAVTPRTYRSSFSAPQKG